MSIKSIVELFRHLLSKLHKEKAVTEIVQEQKKENTPEEKLREKHEEEKKEKYARMRRKYRKVIISLYTFFIGFGIILCLTPITIGNVSAGFVLFISVIAYTAASFRVLQEDKIGVIRFFGKAVMEIGSGPNFIPALVCELRPYPKGFFVFKVGSPLENDEGKPIKRNEEKGVVVEDEPLRVTLKGGEDEEEETGEEKAGETEDQNRDNKKPKTKKGGQAIQDVLLEPVTVDPQVTGQWAINDPIAFDGQVGSVNKASRELARIVSVTLQRTLSNRSARNALENMEKINTDLRERLEKLVGEKYDPSNPEIRCWGINILQLGLTTLGLPRTVSHALRDSIELARKGQGEASAIRSKGIAEADVLKAKGFSVAEARKMLLRAEAVGTEAMSKLAKEEQGRYILAINMLREALKEANFSIIPGSELFSTVAGLKEMFTKIGSSAEPPKKEPEKKEPEKGTGPDSEKKK